MFKLIPITRKEAVEIGNKSGYPVTDGNGRTYYATNEERTDVWEFDTKRERDTACAK